MKRNHILVLVAISLIPLLFSTTIPYVSAKRLSLNILSYDGNYVNDYTSNLYVISFQDGNQYTINVIMSDFWGTDITIKISDTPYMLSGQIVDENSFDGDIMHYNAMRTGDHYIQISSKLGSGFFDIRVDNGITNMASAPNQEFFGSIYILVLILPSLIIILIGIGVSYFQKNKSTYTLTKKSYERVDQQKEKEEEHFCRFCGSKLELSQQICSNCGSTQE